MTHRCMPGRAGAMAAWGLVTAGNRVPNDGGRCARAKSGPSHSIDVEGQRAAEQEHPRGEAQPAQAHAGRSGHRGSEEAVGGVFKPDPGDITSSRTWRSTSRGAHPDPVRPTTRSTATARFPIPWHCSPARPDGREDAPIGALESAAGGTSRTIYKPDWDGSHEPRWGEARWANGEDPYRLGHGGGR